MILYSSVVNAAWRNGGIAQLARAFGSYPECRRFESHCRYQIYNKECRITCPPLSYIRPGGQAVKTPPFHGGNTGSSPVRVTKKKSHTNVWLFSFWNEACLRHMKNEAAFGYEAHPYGCMKIVRHALLHDERSSSLHVCGANASYERSECFIWFFLSFRQKSAQEDWFVFYSALSYIKKPHSCAAFIFFEIYCWICLFLYTFLCRLKQETVKWK